MKKSMLLLVIMAIVALGATALFVASPPEGGGGDGPVNFIDPDDPNGGGNPPPPNPPSGQDNYYDGQIIYIDEGLSFNCKRSTISISLMLSNINESSLSRDDIMPSGMSNEEYTERAIPNGKLISNESVLRAFRETFTQAELAAFGTEEMNLYLTINQTGDIVRLTFGLDTRPVFTNVPAAKYGTLYHKLKAYMKLHVADTTIYLTGASFYVRMDLVAAGAMLFEPEQYWRPGVIETD